MRGFDYDGMVHDALLSIVREVLRYVEVNGLPGSNHFYVTFRTDRSDVVIPNELRETHPEEITVVLQHQFWDLKVFEDYFEVTLSFQDRYEKISVPFNALISFLDPSANFGLQFIPEVTPEDKKLPTTGGKKKEKSSDSSKQKSKPKEGNIVSLDSFRKKD